jgi:Icc-related predicted phosphoesterase
MKDFLTWFGNLPHKHKLLCFGNHELLESQANYDQWAVRRGRSAGSRDVHHVRGKCLQLMKQLNITYLEDSGVEIDGIKFWGSPVQPEFYSWGFNRKRGDDIKKHWDRIPDNTNVLITHGPMKGMRDYVPYTNEHVGCEDLQDRIATLKDLRLHVSGHIHLQSGRSQVGKVTFVNASILNDAYNVAFEPITVELL